MNSLEYLVASVNESFNDVAIASYRCEMRNTRYPPNFQHYATVYLVS